MCLPKALCLLSSLPPSQKAGEEISVLKETICTPIYAEAAEHFQVLKSSTVALKATGLNSALSFLDGADLQQSLPFQLPELKTLPSFKVCLFLWLSFLFLKHS